MHEKRNTLKPQIPRQKIYFSEFPKNIDALFLRSAFLMHQKRNTPGYLWRNVMKTQDNRQAAQDAECAKDAKCGKRTRRIQSTNRHE